MWFTSVAKKAGRASTSVTGGMGTPPLLSLHPVGPARMSGGAEMFA